MKLHVGCGARRIPGWLHIDSQPGEGIDLVADARSTGLPNRYAQTIYASHVLEHFARAEVDGVLREWYRLLAPGGTLRLAVPNMRAWCRVYLETGDLSVARGAFWGGQRDAFDLHKTGFDEATLTEALTRCGFVDVRAWNWRLVEHAGVDDYSRSYRPHMDFEHGELMSLNLEADRPRGA